MATAKNNKTALLERTARRLDFLAEHARVMQDSTVWSIYQEAKHITELLGYTVTQENGHHKVVPC